MMRFHKLAFLTANFVLAGAWQPLWAQLQVNLQVSPANFTGGCPLQLNVSGTFSATNLPKAVYFVVYAGSPVLEPALWYTPGANPMLPWPIPTAFSASLQTSASGNLQLMVLKSTPQGFVKVGSSSVVNYSVRCIPGMAAGQPALANQSNSPQWNGQKPLQVNPNLVHVRPNVPYPPPQPPQNRPSLRPAPPPTYSGRPVDSAPPLATQSAPAPFSRTAPSGSASGPQLTEAPKTLMALPVNAQDAGPFSPFRQFSATLVEHDTDHTVMTGALYRSGNRIRLESPVLGQGAYTLKVLGQTTWYLVTPSLCMQSNSTDPEHPSPFDASGVATVTTIGSETANGYATRVEEFTVTPRAGNPVTIKAWLAPGLKGFPVRVDMPTPRGTMRMEFKDVRFRAPEASLFNPARMFRAARFAGSAKPLNPGAAREFKK